MFEDDPNAMQMTQGKDQQKPEMGVVKLGAPILAESCECSDRWPEEPGLSSQTARRPLVGHHLSGVVLVKARPSHNCPVNEFPRCLGVSAWGIRGGTVSLA